MSDKIKNIPELNFKVIFIGIILSVVMGAANVYLGLKAGMTVSASIPASVVGMLILKYINNLSKNKNNTILEANQIQTAASAGESLAAGIIFTMPALIIIGIWKEFDMVLTTIIAFTGGLLGILFMIPMRKVFIVNNKDNLKFPEGLACASILKVGQSDESSKNASIIIKSTLIGAVFKGLISFVGVLKSILEGAIFFGNRVFYFGGDISPALVAVGFIVRLNIAILIFIGGFLGWLIGIPLLSENTNLELNPLDGAWEIWSSKIRYVGVGAMVIGGISSIVKVRSGIFDAIKILLSNPQNKKKSIIPQNEQNISSLSINILSIIAICLVGIVYYSITNNLYITIITTIIMLIMSFFFTAVASYIVGLVGNSNSPVSGMTITAVLFTGGLLYIFGFSGTEGMVATLGVAAIVCCAACTSGDVCNDLKTGHIVGATPFKQQIMQIIGVGAASLIMAPTLQLLHNNTPGGIGGKELSAPQAGLFASLADGFFGIGFLPWNMILFGLLLGIVILSIDIFLDAKNYNFRLHLMPIAVGIYLPFGLSTPILIGGILSYFITINTKKDQNELLHNGVLASSGLIAGESLMGILLALLASIGINSINLDLEENTILILTIISSAYVILWLYRSSKKS